MSRKEHRNITKRKERYRAVVIVLKIARSLLSPHEDGFIVHLLNTLIDRIYNQNDLRYKPETIVFRAIKHGYCTRKTIEAKTLISGELLDKTIENLTVLKKIKFDDGLYVEWFE